MYADTLNRVFTSRVNTVTNSFPRFTKVVRVIKVGYAEANQIITASEAVQKTVNSYYNTSIEEKLHFYKDGVNGYFTMEKSI